MRVLKKIISLTWITISRIYPKAYSTHDRQSDSDWVLYKHHWGFQIHKKIIPILTCLVNTRPLTITDRDLESWREDGLERFTWLRYYYSCSPSTGHAAGRKAFCLRSGQSRGSNSNADKMDQTWSRYSERLPVCLFWADFWGNWIVGMLLTR